MNNEIKKALVRVPVAVGKQMARFYNAAEKERLYGLTHMGIYRKNALSYTMLVCGKTEQGIKDYVADSKKYYKCTFVKWKD